ncbi:MAG: metalloregulator ArsR/SmtB family transcription factor [Anaerolineae bacterium]|nr:metalloregulator ArsR/SmtB family transcription factor [Anaerolineae bacterium]
MKTDQTLQQLTILFSALADPTRAKMLLLLRDGEKRSGDLAEALAMTASAVSHQLRWLRDNNVVTARKEGREVYYHLADACIREIIDVALRHIQEGKKP